MATATSSRAWPKSKNTKRRRSRRQSLNQYKNNTGLQSPFLLTRLVHFLAAIWHNLSPPLTHESAWKHENKPALHSPFSFNQIGTLSRRHLAQFVSAIDRRSSMPTTLIIRGPPGMGASLPVRAHGR